MISSERENGKLSKQKRCPQKRGAYFFNYSSFFLPLLQSSRNSPLLFTRISARLIHSLSLQTKINDMNTSSYSREPPSPKRATPQNASVGAKVSHPSGNPQLGRKAKLSHLPGPTVDELLQRLNGNAPPTKMIGRKAPGTNGFFLACDAVPWKSSAQREAERLEAMRRQAEEEEEERKKKAKPEEVEEEEEDFLCTQEKRKSLSSQLLPSFVVASQDANKENVDVTRNVPYVKKSENVLKNALEVPLTTRGNDADVVVLDWKKQTAGTDDDVETDFIRSSLTPPKGGEKKKSGDDKSSGKRCVDVRVGSAALSARDGKKARFDVSKTREEKNDDVVVALDKSKEMQKLLVRSRALGRQVSSLSRRLNAFEQFFEDTVTARFEETNGFIFEVLTALSSAPRCVHPFLSAQPQREEEKADKKNASDSAEQKKQISTKPKKMSSKEKASMGLCFREAVTLDDFLDGYNTQVNLSPKRVLALTKAEKSKRSSYINYWKPFARIFRDALSDFETLFGDKAGEYIGEFELAMEEALVVSAEQTSRRAGEQKRWKPVASAFISASAETRETMRTSWNLKGIMNQMHLKTFTL